MAPGPSDKIQLIQYPMHPAKCSLCLRPVDGQLVFLDFGLQVERYGSVNFCVNCAANIGEAVDMVLPLTFLELQAERDELIATNERLAEELDNANRGMDTVRNVFGAGIDSIVSNSDSAEAAVENSISDDAGIAESDSSTGTGSEVESTSESSSTKILL